MKKKSWNLDFEQWETKGLLYEDELQEEKATSPGSPSKYMTEPGLDPILLDSKAGMLL